MNSDRSFYPRLIALEGPAGVGKTSLAKTLRTGLRNKGVDARTIPEFTDSPLGGILRGNTAYGAAKPPWVVGMGGGLALLADKVSALERVASRPDTVLLSDRFLVTQLVLGVREIKTDWEKEHLRTIISLTLSWARRLFAEDSLVIFLESPIEVLEGRLAERLGKPLSARQLDLLRDEVSQYLKISHSLEGWNVMRVAADMPLRSIGERIIERIDSTWI